MSQGMPVSRTATVAAVPDPIGLINVDGKFIKLRDEIPGVIVRL